MALVRVTFEKCVQDSQELGSNDEHMVSRVFFTVATGGIQQEAHVDLKQTVGTDYETGDIEVSAPAGYSGPFNALAFRREVVAYFRRCVGSGASGIRVSVESLKTRMYNNTFTSKQTIEFDVVPDTVE